MGWWVPGVEWLPLLAAAAMMALLAGWLMWLDPASRAHRAFALILVLRGTTMALGALRGSASDPRAIAYFQAVMPYFILPIVPAVIYFLSVYPRPRGWFGTHRSGPWVLLGIGLAAEVLYLLDHGLVWTVVEGMALTPALAAGSGFTYESFGPLVILVGLQFPILAVAALVLARDYVRAGSGSARYSGFLVFAGFGLNALFDASLRVSALAGHLSAGTAAPWLPWGWGFLVLPSLTILPAAALVGLMVVRALRGDQVRTRQEARGFLLVGVAPVLSALLLGVIGGRAVVLGTSLGTLLVGFWRLVLPALATYALVRYKLFDIDLKVRAGVKNGALTAAFLTTFLVASEGTEMLFADRFGTLAGLAAAGILTFGFRPLERRAERLAGRLVPRGQPLESMSPQERLRAFQEQLTLALQDGIVTAKEAEMLAELRDRLELDPSETVPEAPSAA